MRSITNDTAITRKKYLHFIEGTHAFIAIDKAIVDQLDLTEDDTFVEEVTKEGILLRRQGKSSL